MDKFCPGQQSDHFSAEFEVKREKLLVNWGDYQWYTSDTALTSIIIFEWTLDTKGDERSSRYDSLHLTTLRHKFLRPPTLAWCMSNPSWQWIFSPQGQQKLRRLSTEVESILSTSNALMTLKGVDSTSQIQLCTSVPWNLHKVFGSKLCLILPELENPSEDPRDPWNWIRSSH